MPRRGIVLDAALFVVLAVEAVVLAMTGLEAVAAIFSFMALIERAKRLTAAEAKELDAAPAAARDAAGALVVRDVLAPEHFGVLYGPWAKVIG